MRTRLTSGSEPSIPTHNSVWGGYGTCTHPLTFDMPMSGGVDSSYVPFEWSKVMHDTVTPDYFRRSAAGEIINNPFDSTYVETRRQGLTWYTSQFTYYQNTCSGVPTKCISGGMRRIGTAAPVPYLGNPVTFAPTPTLDVETFKNLAIADAYSRIGEQEAQALVILAEGEKTIKSFIDIAIRLIRIGRALRKWDARYLKRQLTPKELEDRWMEGRYAIRPVVYDMCDVIKCLKKALKDKPMRITYRGGRHDSATNDLPDVVTYSVPGQYAVHCVKSTQRIVSVRSGVLTAVDAISDAMIWGLDRPFEAMWELVPFSFVVDWFFNVGTTIAAWTPKYGSKALASWTTVNETVSQGVYLSYLQDLFTQTMRYESVLNVTGGFVVTTTKTATRIPNPNLPILPTFNVKLDAAKLLDLAIWGKRFFKKERSSGGNPFRGRPKSLFLKGEGPLA